MQSLADIPSLSQGQLRGPSDPANRAYLDTYDVDRRSVFVANIPADTTELDLHHVFGKYGNIRNIILHKGESTFDGKFSCSSSIPYLTFCSIPKACLCIR